MAEVSGVLIIDKPEAMTSHDAVNIMRRLYNTKKVGHTGTLDPMATGLLVILIGRAAKAAEYLVSDEKKYIGGLRLGITTDTGDITGNILTQSDEIPDSKMVKEAVESFLGKGSQIPPMYSALKVEGKKLVDLARKGITVERKPRDIEIYSISCGGKDRDYLLNVHCSKGTYIRTLCEDIGARLGCGGTMSSLRRIASGNFELEKGHTVKELEAMEYGERVKLLLPTESLFEELPIVKLSDFFLKLCRSGQEIYQKKIGTNHPTGQRVRLYDNDGFFGLGEVREYENGTGIKAIKQFVLEEK